MANVDDDLATSKHIVVNVLDNWANRIESYFSDVYVDRSKFDDIAVEFHNKRKLTHHAMLSKNGIDDHKIASIFALTIMQTEIIFVYVNGLTVGNRNHLADCALLGLHLLCDIDYNAIRRDQAINSGMIAFLHELENFKSPLSASFCIYAIEQKFKTPI